MTTTQLSPSGWYADPESAGFERYWSGSEWWDQRRPCPATAARPPAPFAAPGQSPLRNDVDYFVGVGKKQRGGRLLLYPDRLVHVDAKMQHFGLIPLILIVVLCRWIAKMRAPKRVAAGGASVVAVPLAIVSQVQIQTRGLGQSLLILTTTGAAYHFVGVRCDKWLADLGTALNDSGRQVSPTTVGISVT